MVLSPPFRQGPSSLFPVQTHSNLASTFVFAAGDFLVLAKSTIITVIVIIIIIIIIVTVHSLRIL
jgi:hypothetical protein